MNDFDADASHRLAIDDDPDPGHWAGHVLQEIQRAQLDIPMSEQGDHSTCAMLAVAYGMLMLRDEMTLMRQAMGVQISPEILSFSEPVEGE